MTRRYNRAGRDAAMEATRRRIVEAVVALHAEQGAARTSYAMIAARADVAVPTVYKHFPTLERLFDGCVSHVEAQAPPLDPDLLDALPDTPARLEALARALARRYRFVAPWLRRGLAEAQIIPELAARLRPAAEAQARLIAAALAPRFGAAPPPVLAALLDAVLGFPAWQRLADAGLPDAAIADALAGAARALAADPDLSRKDPP